MGIRSSLSLSVALVAVFTQVSRCGVEKEIAESDVADNGTVDNRGVGEDLLGRWDLTVQGTSGAYPSWFEVKKSGYATLVGSYVGQFGSARPIAQIHQKHDGSYSFTVPPQWEKRNDDVTLSFRHSDDGLRGETTDDTGKSIAWTGKRAPDLKREGTPAWGSVVELFNGKNLDGWHTQLDVPNGWQVRDGLLSNEKPGNNLVTNRTFDDFELHAEFRYPPGSNSGIYLRGRYEFQIEDNFGGEPDSHRIGGIYGHLTPSVNAAKRAGEWQSCDITLIGRVVTVVLNGERIIDRQSIPGITGGAIDSNEGGPGPIMIQGDHGPVEFRKLSIRPAQ